MEKDHCHRGPQRLAMTFSLLMCNEIYVFVHFTMNDVDRGLVQWVLDKRFFSDFIPVAINYKYRPGYSCFGC